MAETSGRRTPTWVAFLAGVVVAMLLALVWTAWSRWRDAGREMNVRVAPAVPELPAPRLPDAPRIPDAPLPMPK